MSRLKSVTNGIMNDIGNTIHASPFHGNSLVLRINH
jgi:hypothetical protein